MLCGIESGLQGLWFLWVFAVCAKVIDWVVELCDGASPALNIHSLGEHANLLISIGIINKS